LTFSKLKLKMIGTHNFDVYILTIWLKQKITISRLIYGLISIISPHLRVFENVIRYLYEFVLKVSELIFEYSYSSNYQQIACLYKLIK
jgi:hypothetical protein